MRKLTALLLCFFLLYTCSVGVFAAGLEEEKTASVISLSVPDSHKLTVEASGAKVFYEGVSAAEFAVGRLSEPRLLIRAESGRVIRSVMLNGVDVSDQLHGGYLTLEPVYEDKILTVATDAESPAPAQTYTVKGKVTLNGQPLAQVDLELRSTVKTTRTDGEGNFVFTEVSEGKHSLTALKNGKVIGYLSFELKKDNTTDVAVLEGGAYVVSIDQNGAGVELHLVLSEQQGSLTPSEAVGIQKPSIPETGDNPLLPLWWLLLIASLAGMVMLEMNRRKKTAK